MLAVDNAFCCSPRTSPSTTWTIDLYKYRPETLLAVTLSPKPPNITYHRQTAFHRSLRDLHRHTTRHHGIPTTFISYALPAPVELFLIDVSPARRHGCHAVSSELAESDLCWWLFLGGESPCSLVVQCLRQPQDVLTGLAKLEELYRKHWGKGKGLLDCRVGYTGGKTEAPSYYDVCSGRTGHAESLLIVFDPDRVTYPQLVEFFYSMHDPTTLNRQGADSGTQYRSAIYAENDEQLKIAEEITAKVKEQWYKGKSISTEIRRSTKWYDAEDNHQEYLDKEPHGYHCPAHFVRKFPALK